MKTYNIQPINKLKFSDLFEFSNSPNEAIPIIQRSFNNILETFNQYEGDKSLDNSVLVGLLTIYNENYKTIDDIIHCSTRLHQGNTVKHALSIFSNENQTINGKFLCGQGTNDPITNNNYTAYFSIFVEEYFCQIILSKQELKECRYNQSIVPFLKKELLALKIQPQKSTNKTRKI